MSRTFVGMPKFAKMADRVENDTVLHDNISHATRKIRAKRARVFAEVPDAPALREAGAAIKDDVIRHLGHYLRQLEESVTARGGHVHWAEDGEEASRIITELVKATGTRDVVKVKSMVSEEIGLDEALVEAGIEPIETDLGAFANQLRGDRPSHIIAPSIHLNRDQIRDTFVSEMHKHGRPAPEGLTDSPEELTEAARLHLREKFLKAKVGISGGNFAVAETGTVLIFEGEGNGRMCSTLPDTLISVIGIEKLLPTWQDLEVFLQLLPLSAVGERQNTYISMWSGPTPGDGPSDFHLVLVDNGRTRALADPVGRQALRCIRCSACLNVCPVFEHAGGGQTYGAVYSGPIGAILTPQLGGLSNEVERSLPYASTLCGACSEVCPVKIDFPEVLLHLRSKTSQGKGHAAERVAMSASRAVFEHPHALGAVQRMAGTLGNKAAALPLPGPSAAWTRTRDLPDLPDTSFRRWWRKEHGQPDEGEA
ncbi:lactate utilization protein [Streptomyces sp. AV19]|uniref:lactate utilization protein B n=1 Tax=Streptomyces sp. AV19 TaxID=2793068 RepID=UPI0018FE3BBB|nr:lactate utilization protein B [Streptomyces sp. AV19]MBH1937944.1 lactate utilization protein [Streptomyces sp. AV19]MDG4536883.1 lactate utilization protein [Streptomyces sp. AV19]